LGLALSRAPIEHPGRDDRDPGHQQLPHRVPPALLLAALPVLPAVLPRPLRARVSGVSGLVGGLASGLVGGLVSSPPGGRREAAAVRWEGGRGAPQTTWSNGDSCCRPPTEGGRTQRSADRQPQWVGAQARGGGGVDRLHIGDGGGQGLREGGLVDVAAARWRGHLPGPETAVFGG
jgi:hypothetical protein